MKNYDNLDDSDIKYISIYNYVKNNSKLKEICEEFENCRENNQMDIRKKIRSEIENFGLSIFIQTNFGL